MSAPLICGVRAEFEFTLASVRRIREELGLSLADFGAELDRIAQAARIEGEGAAEKAAEMLKDAKLDLERDAGRLAYAFVAHIKELKDKTVEEIEAGIDLTGMPDVLESIAELLKRKWGASEDEGPTETTPPSPPAAS